jgi:hypothetical protein
MTPFLPLERLRNMYNIFEDNDLLSGMYKDSKKYLYKVSSNVS